MDMRVLSLSKRRELWASLKLTVKDDSLSIALFSLFVLCVAAQAVIGWSAYNGSLQNGHFPKISFVAYLGTGNFLDGAFSNWQAAILQLAVLISFSSVLRQKGAAHSRKPEGLSHRRVNWKLRPRPTWCGSLYANSLSLTFFGVFAVAFVLHLWFGTWKYNEDQALRHLRPLSMASYAGSADFWFSVFQCWEAEFGAIGIYIVFSIFLRQENSAESKPVDARDDETGETNE